jgi:hypothetical protein
MVREERVVTSNVIVWLAIEIEDASIERLRKMRI